MNNIEVIYLNKKVLREYLDNTGYWYKNKTALPKSKIQWLLNNKRITEDDSCGVLAIENNKIIGLVYMIPDLILTQKKIQKKVYWMIYWWIDNKYNGNVLSTYIYNEALRLANNQVVIKSFADNASDFYNKMPFVNLNERLRYTIFFSTDPSMLIGKFPFLKHFKFVLSIFDYTVSKYLQLLNLSKAKKQIQNLKYEYINELDQDTWIFAEPLCKNDFIYKTKAYINWQISTLQYTQTPINNKQPYTSLETGVSPNIAVYNLKVLKENKIIGFLSFIVNYNELNVKYFLVKDDRFFMSCVDVLLEHFFKLNKKFIFTDDSRLAETINKKYKTIFTHKATKKALAHKDLAGILENKSVLNSDGHFY